MKLNALFMMRAVYSFLMVAVGLQVAGGGVIFLTSRRRDRRNLFNLQYSASQDLQVASQHGADRSTVLVLS